MGLDRMSRHALMKEDLDFFEIRKQWHLEQGESKQQAVRFAAEEVVERIYGMSSDELKAYNFFWKVMEVQQNMELDEAVEAGQEEVLQTKDQIEHPGYHRYP